MKTILTLCLCIPVFVFEQIPNNSFEDWAGYTTEEPVGWITNNHPTHISVSKTTESYTGLFAAKVISNGPSFEGPAPGWLKTTLIPTEVPKKLTLYYKCDSILPPAYGEIAVNQYNNGIFTELGKVEILILNQSFELITISLSSSQIPDSIEIKISSITVNNGVTYEGYISFIVDDIVLGYTLGLTELSIDERLSLYPNPVKGYLTVEVPIDFDIQNGIIQIMDTNGKALKNTTLGNRKQVLFIGDLTPNTYLLRVMNHKRSMFNRFIVQ